MKKPEPADNSVTTDDPSVRKASYEICRKMIDAEKLRALQKKSNVQGAWHFSAHMLLVLLFAFGAKEARSSPGAIGTILWFMCLLGQAICMAFFFTGFHEMTHETAFASRLTNILCGNLWGFLIFRPFEHYRCYHYNHHKFTGDPLRDPELQNSFIDLKLDNFASYFVYLSGAPFWVDRVTTLVRHALFGTTWIQELEWTYLTAKSAKIIVNEARIYAALYATVVLLSLSFPDDIGSPIIWHGWILPTIVAQPFLRFYLLAEHTGCPQGDNMLSNTRTTETFHWYRWLAWFMPYHAEHHAFPFVPFYQLQALHEELVRNKENERYRKCDPDGDSGYLGVHLRLMQNFIGEKF